MAMTKSQTAAVARIKHHFENPMHSAELNAKHEIKEFKVTETDYGDVVVVAEQGLKGDEGTMAAILCRDRAQIFIGKNGGMSTYEVAKKFRSKHIGLLVLASMNKRKPAKVAK